MSAPPSVARGLLGLAVCATAVLALQSLWRALPDTRTPEPACADPIEIAGERPRLGCLTEAVERGCVGARAGDRVIMAESGCAVVAQGMGAAMRLVLGRPLDLNRATADELALLDGIGPKLAERIVQHRAEHGNFASVARLTDVQGFAEGIVARVAGQLAVAP